MHGNRWLFLCLFVVCGCSDKEAVILNSENEQGVTIEENCDHFVSKCTDDTHYTVCVGGREEVHACPGSMVCNNGNCDENLVSDKTDCDPKNYKNSCDGNTRVACENNLVTRYDCSADKLACYNGDCVITGLIECDPATFVDKCIGNQRVTCEKIVGMGADYMMNKVYVKLCGEHSWESGEICGTVDGTPRCYKPCTKEQYESQTQSVCNLDADRKHNGRCVESSEHRYVFVGNLDENGIEECTAQDHQICRNGSCVSDERLWTTCSPENDKPFCENGLLYHCTQGKDGSGWHYEARSCASEKLICTEVQGLADCYRPCEKEGDTFYECDWIGDELPKGESWKHVCTRVPEGLVDFVTDANCVGCVKSKSFYQPFEDYGDVCVVEENTDDYAGPRCEGNAIFETTSFPSKGDWIKYSYLFDCGDGICVQDPDNEWRVSCKDPCTPEEAASHALKYECDINRTVSLNLKETDNNVFECTEQNGQYYWMYKDSALCQHGCSSNEPCRKIHPEEGNRCMSYGSDMYPSRCDNNILVECSYVNWIEAFDCKDRTCAVLEGADKLMDDANRDRVGGCFELCTEEEIANPPVILQGVSWYIRRYHCTETENGKYVKTFTTEFCPWGVDYETKQCKEQSN